MKSALKLNYLSRMTLLASLSLLGWSGAVMGQMSSGVNLPALIEQNDGGDDELQRHRADAEDSVTESDMAISAIPSKAFIKNVYNEKCQYVNWGQPKVGVLNTVTACAGYAGQKYTFQYLSTSSRYQIKTDGGYCLHAADKQTANGTAVVLATCSSSDTSQLWRIVDQGNGQYQIYLNGTNQCMYYTSYGDGAGSILWPCTYSAEFLWTLPSAS